MTSKVSLEMPPPAEDLDSVIEALNLAGGLVDSIAQLVDAVGALGGPLPHVLDVADHLAGQRVADVLELARALGNANFGLDVRLRLSVQIGAEWRVERTGLELIEDFFLMVELFLRIDQRRLGRSQLRFGELFQLLLGAWDATRYRIHPSLQFVQGVLVTLRRRRGAVLVAPEEAISDADGFYTRRDSQEDASSRRSQQSTAEKRDRIDGNECRILQKREPAHHAQDRGADQDLARRQVGAEDAIDGLDSEISRRAQLGHCRDHDVTGDMGEVFAKPLMLSRQAIIQRLAASTAATYASSWGSGGPPV